MRTIRAEYYNYVTLELDICLETTNGSRMFFETDIDVPLKLWDKLNPYKLVKEYQRNKLFRIIMDQEIDKYILVGIKRIMIIEVTNEEAFQCRDQLKDFVRRYTDR